MSRPRLPDCRRLKAIYVARRAVRAYISLCERVLPSPKDGENIARLCKAKGRPAEAMAWVERGLTAATTRRWGNEDNRASRLFLMPLQPCPTS